VRKAAADAGRPPPRVVAAVVVCITDHPDEARTRIAATSKPYATFPAFKAMLDREGVTSQVDVGIVGDESYALEKAHKLIDAGATELAVRESTGTPEEAERTRAFLRSLVDG
jgi:5,10-methylenetetrahydromethanopterin reductase